MGKIYELFGRLEKDSVRGIPNVKLKKSIVSGNYGKTNVKVYIDKNNRGYKYLMDKNSEYGIEYWYERVVDGTFTWTDMSDIVSRFFGVREGFHPGNYGVGGVDGFSCYKLSKIFGCPLRCTECHKKSIEILYREYMKNNGKKGK